MIGLATLSWEEQAAVDTEAVRLHRGDPQAMVSLLERYQHRLYRFLVRMVHEPATAEDLFQQTWLRVAENAKRFDPSRGFEPWLFSIARNLTMDYFRRVRPESLDEQLPSGDSRAETLPAMQMSAVEILMREERTNRLAQAMSELGQIYCEVLTLRFGEEMKLEEIAEVLNVPLPTVKTRLRRALEAMRVKLGHRLPGGEMGAGLRRMPTPQAPTTMVERVRASLMSHVMARAEQRSNRRTLAWLVLFAWTTTLATWPILRLISHDASSWLNVSFVHTYWVLICYTVFSWLAAAG